MRRFSFVGASTIAVALAAFATGCSSAPVETASDTPGATQTQDVSSGPAPWCPLAAKLDVAESPDDYLPPVEVKLEEVLDGDTAYLTVNGITERVRFHHINAEEVRHDNASPAENAQATPFGEMTKRHVEEVLSQAKKIEISAHRSPDDPNKPETDAWARLLALVWVDGALLQQQLIAEGYSGYYTKYGCGQGKLHDTLLWSEAEANQKNRGVWDPQYKNQHLPVLSKWIGVDQCRPNPLKGEHYCPAFESLPPP